MSWWSKWFGGSERVQPVSIDDDNFEAEVLRSELPVLLDVWSPTCAPCKRLEPIVFALAAKYRGRVKVAEINAHGRARVLQRLNVRSTPTVLYFDRGREVERVIGFRGQLYHEELIEQELLAGRPVPGEVEAAEVHA